MRATQIKNFIDILLTTGLKILQKIINIIFTSSTTKMHLELVLKKIKKNMC